ncbi:MAG TPA: TlyA family RNA methyltransferase [Myxococcaceae bacterium]|nr:TlyA family RNA methyltransferase [Myxococcaceae bacterium]
MKAPKQRLDSLLVERGLAESRTQAQALILAGQVVAGDQRADKPGSLFPSDVPVRIKEKLRYVSRGGLKLERALAEFRIAVEGKVCADIGASTGGFTDCLLQAGARKVYAIDVGHGQLHPKLLSDSRVLHLERINARYLSEAEVPELVDLVTIDVSFISLTQVLPAVLPRLRPGGTLIALVKPQFEVGRQNVAKGGVVKNPEARESAIQKIASFLSEQGLEMIGRVDSPIAGPAGNVEALLAAAKPRA